MTLPDDLSGGYARFREGRLATDGERYRTLAREGQKPRTMVIACADSRAAPETIFDAGPGELFVMRNVANLVPPDEPNGGENATAAAIEFAIAGLRVERILVLGHARCGGIAASLNDHLEPLGPGDHIRQWIAPLRADRAGVDGIEDATERQTAAERRAIRGSIERLRAFPQVRDAEREGRLSILGAWFDIETGDLLALDETSGAFEPVVG